MPVSTDSNGEFTDQFLQLMAKGADSVDLATAKSRAEFPLLLPDAAVMPKGGVLKAGLIPQGASEQRFVFYFTGGIQISVHPEDKAPADYVKAPLAQKYRQDLRTQVYKVSNRPLSVNGAQAYGRDAADQILGDGSLYRAPGVVGWTVPWAGTDNYVSYSIYGHNSTAEELVTIAESMK